MDGLFDACRTAAFISPGTSTVERIGNDHQHMPASFVEYLKVEMLSLLEARAPDQTICPSEAARAVAAKHQMTGDAWRTLMEPARAAAGELVIEGLVVVTQRREIVDLAAVRGPIRIRRRLK